MKRKGSAATMLERLKLGSTQGQIKRFSRQSTETALGLYRSWAGAGRAALFALIFWTLPAMAANGGGPKHTCLFERVPISVDDKYAVCRAQPARYEANYQACLVGHRNLRPGGLVHLLLQREQLKLVFTQELFYLSRYPKSMIRYNENWSAFRARWENRLAARADLMKLDTEKSVGVDQCSVHRLIGKACDSKPEVDEVSKRKQLAEEGFQSLQDQKMPLDLPYDIVRAILVEKATRVRTQGIDSKFRDKWAEEIADGIYRFYPELAISPALNEQFMVIIKNRQLVEEVARRIKAETSHQPLSLPEVETIVDEVMVDVFDKKPIKKSTIEGLESGFLQVENQISLNLQHQVKKGETDVEWLLEQDYLLASRMLTALRSKKRAEAGVIQTLICHNQLNYENQQKLKSKIMIYGGAAALATGVGAMVAGSTAAGTVLTAASLGLAGATSTFDVLGLAKELSQQESLFLLKGADHSKVERSRTAALKTFSWATANILLAGYPLVALSRIHNAHSAAVAAGDLARAAQLNQQQGTIIRWALALNSPLMAETIYQGAKAGIELNNESDAQKQSPNAEISDRTAWEK